MPLGESDVDGTREREGPSEGGFDADGNALTDGVCDGEVEVEGTSLGQVLG